MIIITYKRIISFLLIVFLIVASKDSYGQEIKFSRLNIEDGLPSNMINVVFQSQKGFIWFGTREGLARFDGHRIVQISLPEEEFGLVARKKITAICEDDENNLWIGTGYGVLCFNLVTETFSHYLFDEENKLGLSNLIYSLTV
ncbi:MAG: hypothetical protein CSA36_03920, partial [Draconibacterium sp.]